MSKAPSTRNTSAAAKQRTLRSKLFANPWSWFRKASPATKQRTLPPKMYFDPWKWFRTYLAWAIVTTVVAMAFVTETVIIDIPSFADWSLGWQIIVSIPLWVAIYIYLPVFAVALWWIALKGLYFGLRPKALNKYVPAPKR